MSPQTKRKLIKNIEAKVLPYSVITLLIIAGIGGMFIINPGNENIARGAAVGDFQSYKTITISAAQVDEELHGFPLFINLSSDTDLASDCVPSGSDIAFFDTDQTTQLAHEIEYFDGATGSLRAWVNVSIVSATSDTVIYMYYNDSDIGASATNKDGVWNKTVYHAVWHMNDSSGSLTDSCELYDGTFAGNLPTAQISDTGYCQRFDEDDDYIAIASISGVLASDVDGSVFIRARSGDEGDTNTYCALNDKDDNADYLLICNADFSGGAGSADSPKIDSNTASALYGTGDVDTKTWKNFVMASSNTANHFYIDGLRQGTNVDGGSDDGTWFGDFGSNGAIDNFAIGALNRDASGPALLEYLGQIDELRVLKLKMDDSWYNAVHNSLNNDTSGGFFTLGAEQAAGGTTPSTYTLNGLSGSRINFAGTAGNTVWCNSSGTTNQWIEINMTVNASDNVSEIRVFVDDFRDAGTYCNASNITLFASSDNSSYGVPTFQPGLHPGHFTDGGCNMTINATTWNAGTMGADPFTDGGGITNRADSIYFVLRVNITATLPTKTLLSGAIDSCKVHIGYWT